MCIYRGPYILIKLLIVNNRNFAIEDTIPGNFKEKYKKGNRGTYKEIFKRKF